MAGFPFDAGREPAAATAAQAGGLDFVHDVLAGHGVKRLGNGVVAVVGDIAVDVAVLYYAAVAQRYADLVTEKVDIVDLGDMAVFRNVEESVLFKNFALYQMGAQHLAHVFRVKVDIEDALGQDQDDGADRAGAHAARLVYLGLVGDAELVEFVDHRVAYGEAVGGYAARAGADEYLVLVFAQLLLIRLLNRVEIRDAVDFYAHVSSPPTQYSAKMSSTFFGVTYL